MSIEVTVVRKEVMDWRKKEFIDELLPTLTVKRAARVRGYGDPGSDITIGSHYVGAGSSFRMTQLRISMGTPGSGFWWSMSAQGTPYPGEDRGTVDVGFLEAAGGETNLMDPMAPKALGPGTFYIYALASGSAVYYGCSFEGLEF